MTAATVDAAALRVRSLRGNATLALAGDLAAKGSQLALMVIAARVLPVKQMAVLGVSLAATTLLTSAFDAGVSLVISRDGAAGADPARLAVAALRARFPYVAAAAAAVCAVGLALGHPGAAAASVVAAAAGAATLTCLAIFRAHQDLLVEARFKLASGVLGLAAATGLMVGTHSAAAVLLGLAAGQVLLLPRFAARHLHGAADEGVEGAAVVRTALPFGAIAIATLAYYRLPTLALGATASAAGVARYTIAAALAFGTLAAANAITTGLLPRLAASADVERRVVTRTALDWTVRISLALAALVVAAGPGALGGILGENYAAAFEPLGILLAATVAISASGVLGTALTAADRSGTLIRQVAWTLVANLAAVVVLAPRFGANGAAIATLLTELIALVFLARAARGLLVPLGTDTALVYGLGAALVGTASLGPAPARVASSCAVLAIAAAGTAVASRSVRIVAGALVFLGLDAYAISSNYGMRVISDTPTYLAIVPKLAATPFHTISVFMRAPSVDDPHATPYLQAIALVYRFWDSDAHPSPIAVSRLLAGVGIAVTVFVLHAFFVWVRRIAGFRAATIAAPVLLVLFGPAHVIWAGDLTFHGFLYGAYFPQTLAIGLMLWTLVAVDGPPLVWRYLAATGCVAATFVVHPFTGTLLAVLIAAGGSVLSLQGRVRWQVGSFALVAGYAIASRWPGYSLGRAVGESGISAPVLVGGAALSPIVAGRMAGVWESCRPRAVALATRFAQAGRSLSVAGLAVVLALAAWECWLFTRPNPDPLLHSNHLSLYWVEDRWRWPLMYAAGAVGIAGLCRLALRGHVLPLFFATACLGAGALGAIGLNFPLWWRFVLFAQAPLALGAAEWLATTPAGLARRLAGSTLAFNAVFKVATLVLLPTTITYLGSPLQDSYRLGAIVPNAPGVIAADPFTSYFVPGTTGHSVLVVTKAHVASSTELQAANEGYALLHRFYAGRDWWAAAQEMYRDGVRYVLIEKATSLRAPDLVTFSTGPTPLVRTEADRRALGTYYYRNNRVGRLIYDKRPYTLYELSPRKLFAR